MTIALILFITPQKIAVFVVSSMATGANTDRIVNKHIGTLTAKDNAAVAR